MDINITIFILYYGRSENNFLKKRTYTVHPFYATAFLFHVHGPWCSTNPVALHQTPS